MSNIIKAKNIHRTFKGAVPLHVLKGIDLEVERGEFIGIMGRSGSGKSTLLHQLSLLDQPDKGEIVINNENILKLKGKKRTEFRLNHFGYVFQTYALLPEFTALETVAIPLMMAGYTTSKAKKEAEKILKLVGLGERLSHRPFELSGGEQQRVAIARALVHKPKIVFADEPCANLDMKSSQVVMELFSRLNKEWDQTIIMVTHEPEDKKYVDRVVYLKNGKISSQKV